MNKSATTIIAVVLLVLVGAGAWAAHRHTASSSPTPTPAASTASSSAGNVAITGGTNGPSCDSGGYFKPSSVTISSGETVTFSVPSNDPYAGGLQIMGLPGGDVIVARGGSMTTGPITSTVSFSATWPHETECKKGSGTITVQ